MRSLATALGCLVLIAVVPSLDAGAASPRRSPELELLKPGLTYVSNFPFEDRQAACLVLNYEQDTSAFAGCLQGDFPENPWFAV